MCGAVTRRGRVARPLGQLAAHAKAHTWPEALRGLLEWRAGTPAAHRHAALRCADGAAKEDCGDGAREAAGTDEGRRRRAGMAGGLEGGRGEALAVAARLAAGP